MVTQVWVSWGEPSGITVARKQVLGRRSRSSSPSGSGMDNAGSFRWTVTGAPDGERRDRATPADTGHTRAGAPLRTR
ncbi:hypothetical protein Sm713_00520 [Streptomyces sp. TS71-3]|nr:hypothetical protein Sm713_00520 [Streptomyces sp. TS71-3]